VLSDGTRCGMAGTAKGAAGQDLDRHKNRFVAPTPGQIDPAVTLARMLEPGDDVGRFDQEKGRGSSGSWSA
jgi:hypothetical protein